MGGQLLGSNVSPSIPNSVLSYVCANDSFDSIDFVLTLVSVCFNYTSPFFLKYALLCLRLGIYIHGFLGAYWMQLVMKPPSLALELTSTHLWLSYSPCAKFVNHFLSVILLITRIPQAQADVQHLWFGRRAATRIRSQLMAAIYDKALKRKDFS